MILVTRSISALFLDDEDDDNTGARRRYESEEVFLSIFSTKKIKDSDRKLSEEIRNLIVPGTV